MPDVLTANWVQHWTDNPDRPVLVAAGQDSLRTLTGAELTRQTAALAGLLHQLGIQPGDRVVLSGAAPLELALAHIATLRLGAIVIPTNTAYTERELAHIFADATPTLAITDTTERVELYEQVAAEAAAEVTVVDLGSLTSLAQFEPGDAEAFGIDLESIGLGDTTPSGTGVAPALDAATKHDLAMICYTSGTTGAPKGVELTQHNLAAGAQAVIEAWQWTPADRLVLALPLFHMHGLGVGLHGTLSAGASAVLLNRFSVDGVLDAIDRFAGTMFFGVPTMYRRLADSEGVATLAELRLCVSGSAPLDANLHRELQERAGVVVLERYGMTETLMNLSNPFDGERRPGSVGRPLPRVEVRLEPEGRGEILLRGPNVFSGYWRNPEATEAAFTDGWFRTGDIAEVDDDGYYRIVGRSKELIITGGYNVSPREIDEVLESRPEIAEAAAAGVADDDLGEVVHAWVVPAANIDAKAVVAAANAVAGQELARYKVPHQIHVVDALPRNALGKIQRHRLG